MVLDKVPDLPHLPELPSRGAGAALTGRGIAVLADLGADLQPAGWRLTDAAGVDQRRARSLLGQDLDTLEEVTQGELGADYGGSFKIQLVGPWTLAATVEKPRGDKVLSDYGARRDLAQALAEGVRVHVSDVRRRLPAATSLIVQLDEPALAAVLGGRVPTASGFGRHRVVHPPEASQLLGEVVAAVLEAGAEPWVHSCAQDTPLALLRGAGAVGLSVDLSVLSAADHDELGTALEAGETVSLGVVSPLEPTRPPSQTQVTESVVRWLDMLGLDPVEVSDRLVLTPGCGLAGASRGWASEALGLVQFAASRLTVG